MTIWESRQCIGCQKFFRTNIKTKRICGYECAMSRDRHLLLLRNYNLTQERFEEMLKEQGRRCAICGTAQESEYLARSFAIDHDHDCCPPGGSCGKCIRGLLCTRCNLGLGSFVDRIDHLRAAIRYLESWRASKAGEDRLLEEDWGTAWLDAA